MEFGVISVALAVVAILTLPIVYNALDFFFFLFRQWRIGRQLKGLPVQPNAHWLYGHLKVDPPAGEGLLRKEIERAKNRHVYIKWIGPIPLLRICHPTPLRVLLGKNGEHEKPISVGYKNAIPWLGYGLLFSGGQKWARHRKMLLPSFHVNILKTYVDVYNETVDIFLDKLDEGCDHGLVEISEPISLLTLDVLLRCAFSYHGRVQEEVNNEYVEAVTSLSKLFMKRSTNLLLNNDFIYSLTSNGKKFKRYCDLVHRISEGIINQRIQALEDDPELLEKKHRDFLDVILTARDDEGKGLSALDMRSEVDTFLFAGHDTTASALAWTLYSLAKYPQHQVRCQEEIDVLLMERPSANIRWEDLNQMPYLQMCIKEAVRMYPPVPSFGREVSDKPIVLEGVTLPKGLLVMPSAYAIHHNATVWGEDHMEYKPERFLPENVKDMDQFAFIPFSMGPRNCIGQSFAMNEMKVVLSRILHRFRVEVDESILPKMSHNIVLQAQNGIHLKVSRRY